MRRELPDSERWYQRWYVPGLLSLAVGALLVLTDAAAKRYEWPLPANWSAGLLVSLVAFSLGWAVKESQAKLSDELRESGSELRGALIGLASGRREPYLTYLWGSLVAQTQKTLAQLDDRSRSLRSVEDCTATLVRLIEGMDTSRHTEILAMCGQKDWDSPEVSRYYNTNYEKARGGVRVRRIFLQEPGKKFQPGERRVLHEHIDGTHVNVEGRVLFKDKLSYLEQYHVPRGFGFAILGDAVVVHWGLGAGKKGEAGRRLQNPLVVGGD